MATSDFVYIASGFQEDCTQLLELFKKQGSYTFEAFCTAWKEMKFSLVFLCRKSYAEMLEFCEEALNIAKQIMLTSLELIEQIGGLYILYGLYYKIPVENVKIKVTMKEWRTFLSFHEKIKQEEFYDASYIFVKLVVDNAFNHTLFGNEYGIEKSYHAHQEPIDNPFSVLSNIVQEIETGEFSKLQRLSEIYDEQKAKLLNNSSSINKLKLFDKNFYDDIINEIEVVGSKRQTFTGLKKKNKDISINQKEEKIKFNVDKIRPKLGHAFDTDSSDDDMDMQYVIDKERSTNLPSNLDGEEDDEVDDDDNENSGNDY